MGRHRWTSRLTVEDCLPLDVRLFSRTGTFGYPSGTTGSMSWISPYGVQLGRVEYAIRDHENGFAIHFRRQWARLDSSLRFVDECLIPLTATKPHLGGSRFWFMCRCGRRVGRVFLPPNQSVFGCRHCYYLTYQSAQQHDQRKSNLVRNPPALRSALRSKNPKRFFFGLSAFTQLLGRSRKLGRNLAFANTPVCVLRDHHLKSESG